MATDRPPPFETDALLWKAFTKGNTQAFEQLYRAHAGPLLTYGKRLHPNSAAVADAVQDVFLEIWKYRATLTTPANIRYYLLRIMRNRLTGSLSLRSDPLHQADDLDGVENLLSIPSVETLLSDLDRRELQVNRLRRAVDTLPARQQEALVLAYYHQLSNEEIASLMGINTQSVINNINRAIHALRQLLISVLLLASWSLMT
ncbi:RNA polymerase, sigma-24 subunit, ECF subfamily [Fibrella aestuarina BUZ 2]|uniref:RNA polymerase, sigma-24 subunit, ECF subfamily n=1 Tax=Fibrella aestuarina BUZ 2 TaxID=1166018 RepID=I0K6C9_9BACT|nr:sigma-70 family RNA polymerase sigma factor [Fibrella aestuarina]CCG99682.1 RNA polymerase, sigma-24 subunit, ECF subfamily [Fibrella aestuarina BUZ 2]